MKARVHFTSRKVQNEIREIKSLKGLEKLQKESGGSDLIIDFLADGTLDIEVYDDYRE